MIDPVAHACLRAGLALLLLGAAAHKLHDLGAFRTALSDYKLLPRAVVAPVAVGLACCEVALGCTLLVPASGAAPALATAGLLSLYAAAIGVNLGRGRRYVACGCGGPAGDPQLNAGLVLRNGLLVLAALAAALPVVSRPLHWPDAISLIGGGTALALLYTAGDIALANAVRLRTLRSPA